MKAIREPARQRHALNRAADSHDRWQTMTASGIYRAYPALSTRTELTYVKLCQFCIR